MVQTATSGQVGCRYSRGQTAPCQGQKSKAPEQTSVLCQQTALVPTRLACICAALAPSKQIEGDWILTGEGFCDKVQCSGINKTLVIQAGKHSAQRQWVQPWHHPCPARSSHQEVSGGSKYKSLSLSPEFSPDQGSRGAHGLLESPDHGV